MNNPLKRIDVLMGRFYSFILREIYQKRISKRLNSHFGIICRFYPSCSEYSALACEKYGFFSGINKTINRLKRCRPDNFDNCFDLP